MNIRVVFRKGFVFLILLILLLTSCSPPGSSLPENTNDSLDTPLDIKDPEDIQIEYRSYFDEVPHSNCDGANPVFKYLRSLSNASTTTYEVITEAGGLVRGTPVPGIIEAEIETKIKAAISETNVGINIKEYELTLSAEKGEGFNHVLTFQDTYFIGYIDVVFSDGVAKVKVEELVNFVYVERTSEPMVCDGAAISVTQTEYVPPISTDTPQETLPITTEQFDTPLEPLLSQITENIGTGVFAQAAYSNGMAEISYDMINAQYSQIQTINPGTSNTGCGLARYNASELWFAGAAGSSLLINGEKVGQLSLGNGPHGHMISIDISIGDEICIYPIPSGGYGMILGPDVYYHYDSYCYRGFCP